MLASLVGCDAQLSRFDRVDASVGAIDVGATVETAATSTGDDGTDSTTDAGTGTGDDADDSGDDGAGDDAGDSDGEDGPDVTPPDDVQSFTGSAGTKAQTVTLDVTFPATADYSRVDIRRYHASTAGDCTTGILAKRYSGPTFPTSDSFLDDTGGAGRTFSYRACVYDDAGNVAGSRAVDGMTAEPHVIFATSKVFDGALAEVPVTLTVPDPTLSGPERADVYCQQLGATVSADTWRAVLSDDFVDAKIHVTVTGSVVAIDNAAVADDAAELFDAAGTLQSAVRLSETGGARTEAWTGSVADGTRHIDTCVNWSSTNFLDSGRLGQVAAAPADFRWLSDSSAGCNTTRSLYCISQAAEDPFDDLDAQTGANAGEITVTIDSPSDISKIARIDLYRVVGGTAPDTLCDNTVGTLAHTTSSITAAAFVVTDSGLAGGNYSYRACAIGYFDEVLTSEVAENVTAN